MASFAAARSLLRSASASRTTASRVASAFRCARSLSPSAAKTPFRSRTIRCPAQTSFCVESMLPYHSAIASALMTSMLSISHRSYGWLPDACDDDV